MVTIFKHFKNSLGIHNVGHAYTDVFFILIPILLPLLKTEFNLSYVQSGLLISVHVGARSLFAYISGHFGDKYDKRVIISAGFVFSSIFVILLSQANNIYSITGFFLLLGIAVSTFHPLATALVGGEAVCEHNAFYLGVFESTGSLGIIFSTLTFGLLVDSWGWRNLLLILSVPGFILAWYYLRSARENTQKNIPAEYEVSKNNIILFIIARGVRSIGIGAIFSFLAVFATDHIGFSPGTSSWLVSVLFLGCIVGSLGGGWYSDLKSPILIILISMYSIIAVIFSMTFIDLRILFFLLVFFFGVSQGGFFTSQNSWLTKVSTSETRGSIMGFAFFIDGVSVTIAPAIYGWLADSTSLIISYRLTLLPVIISFLLYFILKRNIETGKLEYKTKLVNNG